MEFNEKLQELRRQKGLTQEELAQKLFVSRTAISKWESGRGYPSIDSLKSIAGFFSITIDELLSSNELLTIAEDEKKQTKKLFCDLIFGALDLSAIMLLFLPIFAARNDGTFQTGSLITLDGIRLWLWLFYIDITTSLSVFGILTLALQNCKTRFWIYAKTKVSLALSVIALLLFILSLQPYAAAFIFITLALKVFLLIRSVSNV